MPLNNSVNITFCDCYSDVLVTFVNCVIFDHKDICLFVPCVFKKLRLCYELQLFDVVSLTGGTAGSVQGQHSLDGHIHGRGVEGLKHDLERERGQES